jgi:hypothetical protein
VIQSVAPSIGVDASVINMRDALTFYESGPYPASISNSMVVPNP